MRPAAIRSRSAPGTVALLTTPDAREGNAVLNPGNAHPDWQQAVAARAALGAGFYRPGRSAAEVRCPLLVLVCDRDESAPPDPALRAAASAPAGQVVRLAGDHYSPFRERFDDALEAELTFLRRHLGVSVPATPAAAGPR